MNIAITDTVESDPEVKTQRHHDDNNSTPEEIGANVEALQGETGGYSSTVACTSVAVNPTMTGRIDHRTISENGTPSGTATTIDDDDDVQRAERQNEKDDRAKTAEQSSDERPLSPVLHRRLESIPHDVGPLSKEGSTLGLERRGKLDAGVGSHWSPVYSVGGVGLMRKERIWLDSYDRLKRFKSETGHCMVPQSYEDDPKLGLWVKNQRQKKGIISEEQRDLLNEIGFVWMFKPHKKPPRDYSKKTKNDRKWETMFDCLSQYRKEHGNCIVKSTDKDASLYHWVINQRKEFHQKTYMANKRSMRLDRKERLEALGFDWGTHIERRKGMKKQVLAKNS